MDKNKCSSCGEAPHKCSCKNKEFTKAVIEINNPDEIITLMRKVVIPASMGDDTTVPPAVGKYKNVLLYYEANKKSYLYSSDGIPTQLVNGITNYEDAINLPEINGVTLMGNKSSADLKLADAPMVITVAAGNTSWSGADTAEDVYDFFLNKGKVNIIFNGGGNYSYEIVSAAYIPEEEKMMCTLAVATIATGETAEFEGNALFGTMTLYTAGKAVDVSQIELQPKLYIADFTGLDLNYNELSGVPATNASIGMVKPGDGLEIASDGTLSISDIEQYAHFFDTVADMKASAELTDGDYVKTLGYYSPNDEGGVYYKISSTIPSGYYETLTSGLYAELIIEPIMNVKQFGAKGDGVNDDTAVFQTALDNSSKILVPDGEYRITQNISISHDNLTISGIGLAKIIIETSIGFDIQSKHDIIFENLYLSSPTYYAGNTSNRIISVYGSHGIKIVNNEICFGRMGVVIGDSYDIAISGNLIHDFKGWGVYLGGNQDLSASSESDIKNCRIYNNESYNSTYDGIKMTGYIENVMVYNNICHDNTRDGFDWAGHSAKDVEVFDNMFYDNTLCGTDFKTLTRTSYPFDDTKTKQVESIHFHDNVCYRNMSHGLNFQLQYSDNNYNNIVVENNVVKIQNKESTTSEADGIRIAPLEATVANAMIVKNNTIYGDTDTYGNGIRLTNTNNVLVKDNEVTGIFRRVCYVDYNNEYPGTSAYNTFDNNLLVNNRTSSNVFNSSASVTYTTLINNKMHSVTTSYIIDANTVGESTNVFNNNTDTTYFSATPTGRTTKNIIYLSNDPATTGCVGWIGYENNSSARYRVYIPISS